MTQAVNALALLWGYRGEKGALRGILGSSLGHADVVLGQG